MPRTDRDFHEAGLDAEGVSVTLQRAFAAALGLANVALEDDPGFEAAGRVAAAAFQSAGDEGELELRWSDFAAMLYHAHRRAGGVPGPEQYDDVPRDLRVAWEATARHAANVFALEDESDLGRLGDLERMAGQWAAKRRQAVA